MRNLFALITPIALLTLACGLAGADPLTITLDQPTLNGSAGETLSFFGVLSNTTTGTLFLNGDNFNLTGLSAGSIDDSPFFANAPVSLAGGGGTGDIQLFNVDLPASISAGNYGGTFQVLGGVDGSAQDLLGGAQFSVHIGQVNAAPEPFSGVLLSLGLVLAVMRRPRGGLSRAERAN